MSELEKLRFRINYLEGLTDADVQLIRKLQVENGELKHSIATGYCGECDILKEENKELQGRILALDFVIKVAEKHQQEAEQKLDVSQEALGKTFNKLADNQQKLKTGSRMLDEWEKSTSHPDATLVNIRNLKKIFTQNTDYVQKEES